MVNVVRKCVLNITYWQVMHTLLGGHVALHAVPLQMRSNLALGILLLIFILTLFFLPWQVGWLRRWVFSRAERGRYNSQNFKRRL